MVMTVKKVWMVGIKHKIVNDFGKDSLARIGIKSELSKSCL